MLESLRSRSLVDFPPIRLQLFSVTLEFLNGDVVVCQTRLYYFITEMLVKFQLVIDATKLFAIGNLLFEKL